MPLNRLCSHYKVKTTHYIRKIASTEIEGRSAQGGRTAAAVVASRTGPTQPVTRSVEVQTHLTWPKGQEVPSVLPPSASSTSQRATQTSTHKLPNNTADGPQTSGKRQSSRSPRLLQQAAKTTLINLAAGPPIHGKRSLDLLGLGSLILRSQRIICSSRWIQSLVMAAHQIQTTIILLSYKYD